MNGSAPIRLLVLSPIPEEGAGCRFRIAQFIPFLESNGFEVTLSSLFTPEFFRLVYPPVSHHAPAWPIEEVERALKLVQGFDPIGVAARDLQECLLLQLRHLGMGGTPAEKIITDHMRLLQNHQIPELARKLAMSIDDLKQHTSIWVQR